MILSLSLDLSASGRKTEPKAALRARAEAIDAVSPDFVLLAGTDGDGVLRPPQIDALVEAAWITGVLRSACVVAGLPALHSVPFHVARALSAIDFLSGGRAGWMPLTGDVARFDAAYGTSFAASPDDWSARTDDFVGATQALLDSWDDDALILDKGKGQYLDSGKVRRVDYRGPYYRTMGPLNAARPPQGYPVLLRDVDALAGSAIQADVLIGTPRALLNETAPILLVKADCAVDGAVEAAVAMVDSGSCQGLHLYGPGAVEAAARLRRNREATPRAGKTSRAALGLAHPANPYSLGA